MIVLASTTDKLIVSVTGTVGTAGSTVSTWRDISDSTSLYQPGRTFASIAVTATNYDLVTAPAASTQRVIDTISVYNANATTAGSQTAVVSYSDNGTLYVLARAILMPGERLEYADGAGWQVYSTAGTAKNVVSQGENASVSTGSSRTSIGSTVANNNGVANTLQDITGLQFAVTNGVRYYFRFFIRYNAAATTTGARFTLNGPATTFLNYRSEYTLAAGSRTTNEGLQAYGAPAASNASSLTTGNYAIIEGIAQFSASGTVQAQFASEVANSAITVQAYSYVDFGSY